MSLLRKKIFTFIFLFCLFILFQCQKNPTLTSSNIVDDILTNKNSFFYLDTQNYPNRDKTLPIGVFDSGTGGLTVLEIDKSGKVKVRSVKVADSTVDDLSKNMLMFYTYNQRSANEILSEQSKGAKEEKKNVVDNKHKIKEIGYKILQSVEKGNLTDVGLLFNEHWEAKKKISAKMTNKHFNEIYDIVRKQPVQKVACANHTHKNRKTEDCK